MMIRDISKLMIGGICLFDLFLKLSQKSGVSYLQNIKMFDISYPYPIYPIGNSYTYLYIWLMIFFHFLLDWI